MRPFFPKWFVKELESLPIAVQNKFHKQLRFLLNDLRHPSLRAKKYLERDAIWQARVDDHYRFYFRIEHDVYALLWIGGHKD